MKAFSPAPSALLILAAAAPATARTPPDGLTGRVLNEINGAYLDRTEWLNNPARDTRVPGRGASGRSTNRTPA
jgi:hypothetical protein